MNKFSFKYCFIILFFVIYIYSVNLSFFPLSLKQFLAVLGVIVFFFNLKNVKKTKVYGSLLAICLLIQAWGVVTCLCNNSNEYIYPVEYFISPISAFFASFLICKLSTSCIHSIDDFFKIVLYTVFIESIITVLIFIIPPLYDFADSMGLLLLDETIKENPFARYSRFNGIGEAVYFGVIPSCTLGVMSGLYLQLKNKHTNLYLIIAIFISIISFFVTRYSAVVVFVCFLLFMKFLFKSSKKKFMQYGLLATTLFTILIVVAVNLLPEKILEWALGAFESDSQHNSTETVLGWITSTKFDFKTFIIGDARYTIPGGGYYGGVDIGLYRQIFYGGIIGFCLVTYLHKKILTQLRRMVPKDPYIRFFTQGMFLSYLLCLLKGDLSMIDLYVFVLVNIINWVTSRPRIDCETSIPL